MIGDLGEVYVLDWGLGVSLREEDRGVFPVISDARGIAGTPAYMAPEMLDDTGEHLGVHTDVYLLGAVLHELLTKAPRHVGPNVMSVLASVAASEPWEYPAEVPAGLAEICHCAMARAPAARFASADAFRAAILAFRRHRSSIRLSDEAAQRLSRMKALLAAAQAGDDVERQREIRDLFGPASPLPRAERATPTLIAPQGVARHRHRPPRGDDGGGADSHRLRAKRARRRRRWPDERRPRAWELAPQRRVAPGGGHARLGRDHADGIAPSRPRSRTPARGARHPNAHRAPRSRPTPPSSPEGGRRRWSRLPPPAREARPAP